MISFKRIWMATIMGDLPVRSNFMSWPQPSWDSLYVCWWLLCWKRCKHCTLSSYFSILLLLFYILYAFKNVLTPSCVPISIYSKFYLICTTGWIFFCYFCLNHAVRVIIYHHTTKRLQWLCPLIKTITIPSGAIHNCLPFIWTKFLGILLIFFWW